MMVHGVVFSQGHVMTSLLFEADLEINKGVFLNVLSTAIKSWMDEVAGGYPYLWQ